MGSAPRLGSSRRGFCLGDKDMHSKNHTRPIIYIDGENFLFRVADVLINAGAIKSKDDIVALDCRYLFENALTADNPVIRYYGTRLKLINRTPELKKKTTRIINARRKLASSLFKQKVEFVNSGRLKLRDGDKCKKCGRQDLHLQEKGVDVRIAVDIITESRPGCELYLVSSDTDLLPAVERAKSQGSKIIYVGLYNNLTTALAKNATGVAVLRETEILNAFTRADPLKS